MQKNAICDIKNLFKKSLIFNLAKTLTFRINKDPDQTVGGACKLKSGWKCIFLTHIQTLFIWISVAQYQGSYARLNTA